LNSFDEQIRITQQERQNKQYNSLKRKEIDGDYIYIRFCVWCNAYKNGTGKHDYKVFEQYIKENDIVANWWQRKCIYENYFGYKFEFINERWVRVK
jgi:hypothetical protein